MQKISRFQEQNNELASLRKCNSGPAGWNQHPTEPDQIQLSESQTWRSMILTKASMRPLIEVNRTDRSRRRRRGKSDPTNAESAARVILSNDATSTYDDPKISDRVSVRVFGKQYPVHHLVGGVCSVTAVSFFIYEISC